MIFDAVSISLMAVIALCGIYILVERRPYTPPPKEEMPPPWFLFFINLIILLPFACLLGFVISLIVKQAYGN